MADILQLTAPPGLANYLRPGRTGAATLLRLIAQNQPPCNGVVLDPTLWTMQANLAAAARASGIETVLDPRSLELASAGGREKSGVSALPWAGVDVHTAESLSEASERRNVVAPLAEFAVEREFSAVLAPTHFISSENDEWLAVDDRLVADLRGELDSAGGRAIALYRPLFIHSRLIRPSGAIERIATRLRSRSVDAIWLGVHPFGTASSGSLSLRWYVDACRALHPLGVPLVGIHTGTVGLLLLAIGALGGIESGMTDGEHFNADQFTRAPEPRSDDDDGPRSSLPRVYIPSLGIFLTTREADLFFAHKGMPAQHGCQLPCCPRGVRDMIRSRLPHFALSRMEEVRRIERVPLSLRPQDFLDHYLRQGSDKALAAEKASPRAATARTRFDEWRLTFGGLLDRDGHSMPSFSPSPTGQRLTHAASASH